MWKELPQNKRNNYKRMILAFASLTEAFAQKSSSSDDRTPTPVVNSKYQEVVFHKSFNATLEDIGNTSYDASLCLKDGDITKKYLIGIKTFGYNSNDQKIAQFKANHDSWSEIIDEIKSNATGKNKEEIDLINHELYKELAEYISEIRNMRIESSKANLQGFNVSEEDDEIQSIYHVLMPSVSDNLPCIYVGEVSYDPIDVDNITVLGCTNKNKPTNFVFTDGIHTYKYTSADSQLYMNFNNDSIACETWKVRYAEDAYDVFSKIADSVYGVDSFIEDDIDTAEDAFLLNIGFDESYSWKIKVEEFSGFNSFYAVGSKLAKNKRKDAVEKLLSKYEKTFYDNDIYYVAKDIENFLISDDLDRYQKVVLRDSIKDIITYTGDDALIVDAMRLLYRPQNEVYIPIPNAAKFHREHPDFFCKNINDAIVNSKDKEFKKFPLVFQPSGDMIMAYITQDAGKAIESYEKQTILGEWIINKVFQLRDYEPLTESRLNELGINGMRFGKYAGSDNIYVQFIWIDDDDLPSDYWI